MHGDVVSTLPNTTTYVGLANYTEATEFGVARTGTTALGQNYGWLGAKRRSTDTLGGLTLMGVRLYNAITGRFLSRDPVPGGNDNTYLYPADPINMFDLDGKWGWRLPKPWRRAANRATARVLGGAYRYANRRLGAKCYRSRGMNVCHGARIKIWGRGGTTIGTTYATSNKRSYRSPGRLAHERVHVRQWKRYGLGFVPRYVRAGSNACRNRYERQAGLKRGGYRC